MLNNKSTYQYKNIRNNNKLEFQKFVVNAEI